MTQKITIEGIELEVHYDYQPEEPSSRCYEDNTGYPGCGEEFFINALFHKGVDVMPLMNLEKIDIIEAICDPINQ